MTFFRDSLIEEGKRERENRVEEVRKQGVNKILLQQESHLLCMLIAVPLEIKI